MCGAHTTSGDTLRDDANIPTNCEPPDKALGVYINKYVHLHGDASARRSSVNFSSSEPVLLFTPYTESAGPRLE